MALAAPASLASARGVWRERRIAPARANTNALRVRHIARAAKEDASTVNVDKFSPEDGVRCYVNDDGFLVCEKLDVGEYVVKTAKRSTEKASLPSPADPTKITYCYVLDNGALVCEGLTPGEYQLRKAQDKDIEHMVKHMNALKDGKPLEEAVSAEAEGTGLLDSLVGKVKSLLG